MPDEHGLDEHGVSMSTEYSGSGDPARSLALLWRTQERASRKNKPPISVDAIVRAAMEIADTDGLAALSMRRAAERLGVGTMSLYTYVPGKAELLDVMLDTAYGELSGPGSVGPDWRAELERVARENWALFRRHPWMLHVATGRPVLGPNAMAKYERELRAVADLSLTEAEMDSVVSLVLSHAEGAARRAVEAAQVVQGSGMTDEQWWRAHAPFLSSIVDATRYPTASRVGTAVGAAQGSAFDPAHAFEFGLQRVLDGIGVLIRDRSGSAGPR